MAEPGTEEGTTLGQMLRTRREARGLGQEQAAHQARLQLVFVRALEDDDYHLLPDELYLSRFVYEYAVFLKLDPAVADAAFRRQFRRFPPHTSLYRVVPRLAGIPWRRLLWVGAVILPLVPLTLIVMSLLGKERDVPRPPSPAPAATTERWTPPETAAPANESPPVPVATQGKGQRHVLLVRARKVTWVAVRVDGGDVREVFLREGEMVRWEAGQGFLITVGNAGGVELTLDGQPVPLATRQGQVIRDLVLPGIP